MPLNRLIGSEPIIVGMTPEVRLSEPILVITKTGLVSGVPYFMGPDPNERYEIQSTWYSLTTSVVAGQRRLWAYYDDGVSQVRMLIGAIGPNQSLYWFVKKGHTFSSVTDSLVPATITATAPYFVDEVQNPSRIGGMFDNLDVGDNTQMKLIVKRKVML